tara:strand:+ start:302 stop:481 length:180 start_codon:yes stop_codon:yes gene_type:complete
MVSNMSALVNWITKNFHQINGYGSYIEGESGMYVVVPVKLICSEYGISRNELIYGENNE